MNRISELRKKTGESQSDLAKLLGMTRQAISLYEKWPNKGGREPKLEIWKKLANHFGVTVSELMGVDDYMKSFVETMQKFDSEYEDDLETQLDRLSKSKYKSFELPIVSNALDLILTTDEKYFDQDDINIELGTLIGTLNSLIHNRDDEFNVNNPEFGKEEDTYKAISDTFTALLDKIKAQNKKATDND